MEGDPILEEFRYKETLQEQRESLLEKLTEYAVETKSNTVDRASGESPLFLIRSLTAE
jgi:cohesin complex subunit SA-1/2